MEGGNSINRTSWSTNQTAGDPAGGGIPTPFAFTTPQPGQLLYVRVRGDGSQGCTGFTITFTN